MSLRIRLVHASDDPTLAYHVQASQLTCYQNFTVQRVAKTTRERDVYGPGIHLVVAEDLHGEPLGALRVHVRSAVDPLPVERAIPDHDQLNRGIRERTKEGIGEYTGLWVVDRFRGCGLSAALVSTALAASPLLGAFEGVAFTHHHLRFWNPLGFEVDQTIGGIVYPDSRYRSSVLWIDTAALADTEPMHRRMIFAIRVALSQKSPIYWQPDAAPTLPGQIHLPPSQGSHQASVESSYS